MMHTCHSFKNSDIDFSPTLEFGFFPQDLSSIWIPTSVVKFTDDRFAGFLHYLHNGK